MLLLRAQQRVFLGPCACKPFTAQLNLYIPYCCHASSAFLVCTDPALYLFAYCTARHILTLSSHATERRFTGVTNIRSVSWSLGQEADKAGALGHTAHRSSRPSFVFVQAAGLHAVTNQQPLSLQCRSPPPVSQPCCRAISSILRRPSSKTSSPGRCAWAFASAGWMGSGSSSSA